MARTARPRTDRVALTLTVAPAPKGRLEADTRTAAQQAADWALVVEWCHYSGPHSRDARWGAVQAAVWALQDGYGAPGTTPPQGWDWSGIRDSSPAAQARMAAAVRAIVGAE